ncbi:MAG: flagellar hook-associated protein FlgK [Actinomycetales bacterium]
MSSTFSGLSTALNALMAQRQALDVAGQNIANVNTPGYTRQRAELEPVVAAGRGGLYAVAQEPGWGVMVTDVSRLADALVDARQRGAHASQANLNDVSTTYTAIEQLMNEPSTTGLSSQLTAFWAAWHDVANNPGDVSTRAALLAKAQTVTGTLNSSAQQLTSYWSTQRDQAVALVNDVNTTAQSVAQLNQQITNAKLSGGQANELSDQRDQLVLHLSELTGATSRANSDGSVDVMVGGSPLVHGPHAERLILGGATAVDQTSSTPVSFSWAGGGVASVSGGRLAASLQALNTTIPGVLASYDSVATTLASTVNAAHDTGQDLDGNPATDFFTSTGTVTAATISVAITDPRKVASAVPSGTANLDGSLADRIAQLATSTTGADKVWSTAVSSVGVDSNRAATQATTAASVVKNADADRDSASGVSLDEELTGMLTYQRAYEGASRLLTALDQNLDTLINRTGIAGRA